MPLSRKFHENNEICITLSTNVTQFQLRIEKLIQKKPKKRDSDMRTFYSIQMCFNRNSNFVLLRRFNIGYFFGNN